MTRKPFPPSICSCMATELLRSSTKKANRVALHVKNKIFLRLKCICCFLNNHQLLIEQKQAQVGEQFLERIQIFFFLLTNFSSDFSHITVVGVGIHIQTSTVSTPGLTMTIPCFKYPVPELAVVAKVLAAERGRRRRVESS